MKSPIGGCVSVKHLPLSTEHASRLRGQTMQRSEYEKPDFSAMTAGKVRFGLLGASAMIRAGNEIVSENEVDDPAIYIGQKIAEDLSRRYELQLSASPPGEAKSDSLSDLVETYGATALLLDVKTINWSFLCFPTDWNNHKIRYSVRLCLIDTTRKMVIAEEFCPYQPEYEDSNDAPSYEDLMADRASGLKSALRTAAEHCIAFFKDNALPM